MLILFQVGFLQKKDTSESFKDDNISKAVDNSNTLLLGAGNE